MESVSNIDQIENLKQNNFIGKPEFVNSNITFRGKGNLFYCERDVKLVNANIRFEGNNSLVYLSSTPNSQYPLNLQVYHDSVVFFGRDNNMTAPLNINVQEQQNLVIGDDLLTKFDKWKNIDEILKYRIIVVKRNNIDACVYDKYSKYNFIVTNKVDSEDVSSTMVRNMILNKDKDILKYIDMKVYKYIKRNNLYVN